MTGVTKKLVIPLILGVVLFASCKDENNETDLTIPNSGIIEFTFNGTTYQVDGNAYHEPTTEGDVILANGISMDVDYIFLSVMTTSGSITTGEYPITNGTTKVGVFQFNVGNAYYYAASGDITVTKLTDTEIQGTFDVSVLMEGGSTSSNVTGGFNVAVQTHSY
ncbi:hypothetical protein EP331_13880 [bacterium]|nr:MAG: hypothetical protein EP331_13880 [bacterium]